MSSKNKKINKRYDRYSYVYDFFEFLPENLFFKRIRSSLMLKLEGKILEVGVGTGKNLPYYSNDVDVMVIDFSDNMLARANKKLSKLNKQNIKLKKADVENLPFPNNNFDVVLTTFVFCSVPDPVRGFEEIKRVLKAGGQAIFIEHVKSENKFYQILQDILNPATVGLFGFNINRDTKKNILESGLSVEKDLRIGHNDIFRKFVCLK